MLFQKAERYLDLVKVRLQTQGGTNNNALFLTQQIWKREGPVSFYKVFAHHNSSITILTVSLTPGLTHPLTRRRRLRKSHPLSYPPLSLTC